MFPGCKKEVLARTIEAVGVAGVLAIDIDASIVGLDLGLEDAGVGRTADRPVAGKSRPERTQQYRGEE
ncbi:hypothetical protein D3C83_262910 [compost metagenome]